VQRTSVGKAAINAANTAQNSCKQVRCTFWLNSNSFSYNNGLCVAVRLNSKRRLPMHLLPHIRLLGKPTKRGKHFGTAQSSARRRLAPKPGGPRSSCVRRRAPCDVSSAIGVPTINSIGTIRQHCRGEYDERLLGRRLRLQSPYPPGARVPGSRRFYPVSCQARRVQVGEMRQNRTSLC